MSASKCYITRVLSREHWPVLLLQTNNIIISKSNKYFLFFFFLTIAHSQEFEEWQSVDSLNEALPPPVDKTLPDFERILQDKVCEMAILVQIYFPVCNFHWMDKSISDFRRNVLSFLYLGKEIVNKYQIILHIFTSTKLDILLFALDILFESFPYANWLWTLLWSWQ